MPDHIKERLDMPLGRVLPFIQDSNLSGTSSLGVPTLKNPMDVWICQEIVHDTKPDVIVEVVNRHGGRRCCLLTSATSSAKAV